MKIIKIRRHSWYLKIMKKDKYKEIIKNLISVGIEFKMHKNYPVIYCTTSFWIFLGESYGYIVYLVISCIPSLLF